MLNDNAGNVLLRRAIRLAIGGGTIAATCGVAQAQQAPAVAATAAAPDSALAEVVVTGSRISVPNQVSISPITNVTAEQIQSVGSTRIEDVLNQLPQVAPSQGSFLSNAADGTATVNLRGLNAKRTLVLVDGLRLGPGDPTSAGASDINMIPSELVESVEVLTGGASSVYGADAVAGVVNFKINNHFEGVKLVATGGIYEHHNNDQDGVQDAITTFNSSTGNNFAAAPSVVDSGAQKGLAFIAGLNSPDNNGNATFYATYRNVNAVLESKYAVSACTLASGYSGSPLSCSGSGTTNPARFFQISTAGNELNDNTFNKAGALIPFSDANRFNYGPLNYFQRPDERWTSGLFMHYEFNEHAEVYANTMFMDDRSIAQIAPSGAFQTVYNVPCTNPYLTAQEVSTWCGANSALTGAAPGTTNIYIGRRNVEGGDRQDDLEHTDWRVVTGIRGAINDGWKYDASFQTSIVNLSETYYNDVSRTKIQDALNVAINPATGLPACTVTIAGASFGQAAGCVPWNIFTPNGVTPAATAYLDTPGLERGQVKTYIGDVNLTGDLGHYGVQLPSANNGLKVNVGAEYRDERSFFEPDQEFQSYDLAGQGGPILPVSGSIVSREGFFEANLPLVEDKPFAQSLAVDAGYRYSSYSLGFKTNTYKIGLEWVPVSDYRFRASFSRSVRAPNIGELFSPQSVGLDGTEDPCAGAKPKATQAQCVLAGVPAAQYGSITANSAGQYNGLTGGNPDLKPETALTTSFGIGWTPSYIPNLRAQIDYYDINILNVIQSIGANTILQECTQDGLFCNLIHRNSIGSLWLSSNGYVVDSLANVGRLEEKGIDVDISYAFDLGAAGKLHSDVNSTWLNNYNITPIASSPITERNCAGYWGPQCSAFTSAFGAPVFRWRSNVRTTWVTPWSGFEATVAVRYLSPVQLETLSSNPNLSGGAGCTVASGCISNTDARIPSFTYVDLTAAMKIAEKVQMRIGCNNILDKQAPAIGGSTDQPLPIVNGNTFPQVYDPIGRYFFAQLTVQF